MNREVGLQKPRYKVMEPRVSIISMMEAYKAKHGRKTHLRILRKHRKLLDNRYLDGALEYPEYVSLIFQNRFLFDKYYPAKKR